jgi:hypothetical protein
MVMAGSVNTPSGDYLGTNIVEPQKDSMAYEALDLLFGVRAIENIASGKGTWGDALSLGVTAATFFIPPAKLLKFGPKALSKVIDDAERAAANEVTSEIAKKVALRTADEARSIRDTGLPLAQNPTRPMSEARFKKITEPEPETGFIPEKPPLDKFGDDLVEEVSPYTAKETAVRRYAAKKEKEEQLESTVEVKPAPKKPLTKEEEAIVKQVDEEIPVDIPKAEGQGKTPVINRKTGELEFESPISERTALPSNISVSPRVDRSAWLQNQMDKLTRRKNSLPKEERPAVQAKIDKYDTEFKALMKKMSEKERAESGKLREQLDDLDKAKSAKTKVKTEKFDLEKAKKELEDLREEYRKLPSVKSGNRENNIKIIEKRNKLKQQGKNLAAKIKKMEGN